MLVLTRKDQEVIMIGDDIRITVTAIQHDKVRIGIDAPKGTPIYRKEIWDKIQKGKTDAQGTK